MVRYSMKKRGWLWLGLMSLALILAFLTSQAFAQGGTWATKAPLPSPERRSGAFGEINGKFHYVTGCGGTGGACNHLDLHEVYDPATDTWTSKAQIPTPRSGTVDGVINGKLYVAGGRIPGTVYPILEMYDPLTNTWTQLASMPTPRFHAAGAVIDGQLYVVGGNNGTDILSSMEVYNPVTNTWTPRASSPTARMFAAGGAISGLPLSGKLYVAGGTTDGSNVLDTLEVYDPVTDSWATKNPMPVKMRDPEASAINGKLYVTGGDGGFTGQGALPTLLQYDPMTDTWATLAPMPTPRVGVAAVSINGRLHVVGGWNGVVNFTTHEVFTPPLPGCPSNGGDDDEDDDGLEDKYENLLGTLLGNPDSDGDGIKDGNDDSDGDGVDDEDEDDGTDDECPNDSDGDGVDDEDEDD